MLSFHFSFFRIALSYASSSPLFSLDASARLQVNITWHLYQQVIVWMITWSYRLNSLDNIYLADSTPFVSSRCFTANALSRLNVFVISLTSFCISHTRQYLRESKRSWIRLFVDLQALLDLPGYPLNILPLIIYRRSLCISHFTNANCFQFNFIVAFWQNVISKC